MSVLIQLRDPRIQMGVAVAVVVGGGTNKDWGAENKLSEPVLEFAWCSLRKSMELSTVLKKNFGVDFLLHCGSCLKLLGPLFGLPAAKILQKGVWQARFG